MQKKKIIIPTIPVKILSGNSLVEIILPKISINSKNEAPARQENGKEYLVLFPNIVLIKCGITSPIQLTVPAIETTHATKMVAKVITATRSVFIFIPILKASSSDKLK